MLTDDDRRAADDRDLGIIMALVERLEPEPRHPKAKELLRHNVDWTWDKVRTTRQWDKPVKTGAWASEQARRAPSKEGLQADHIVPFAVVCERLFELRRTKRLTLVELRRLLDIPMAVITARENQDLSDAGLKHAMTGLVGWDEMTDWDSEIWDRHVAVGLDVENYRQYGAHDGPAPI